METPASDNQVVDRLLFQLDDLIHTCKQQIGASVKADILESHGHNQEAREGTNCKQLYDDKWDALAKSSMHYLRQKGRPDVPAPRCNLKGSARLAKVDQEPQLTTADYDTLARAHYRKIELHTDQLAKAAGFTEWRFNPLTSRSTVLPPSAEEALEAFWTRYGKPGKADIFALCEVLGVSRDDTVAFFLEKLRIHAPILEAKEMLEEKAILQRLKNQGRLEELVRRERENDKNLQVPVEGMD